MKKQGYLRIGAMMCFLTLLMGAVGCKKNAVNDGYIEPESVTYGQLSKSNAQKFSDADLMIDGISVGTSIDVVKKSFGEPTSEEQKNVETNPECVLTYEGADGKKTIMFFHQVGATMQLFGVECEDEKRTFARNTHVGMKMEEARDAFYRDENSLNQNVMSEDNATILGKFLYGNVTMDKLDTAKISNGLEYGIINYNGDGSIEDGNVMLEYLYFVPPLKGKYVSYDDDFAQLMFNIDKNGSVSKISWYYYPEISDN